MPALQALPEPARSPGPGWAPIIAAWQEADALLKLPRVVGADEDLTKPPVKGRERTWLQRMADRLKQQQDRAIATLKEAAKGAAKAASGAPAAMADRARQALRRIRVAASGAAQAAKVHAKDLAESFMDIAKKSAAAYGAGSVLTLVFLYFAFKAFTTKGN